MEVTKQALIIFAGTNGFLDDIPLPRIAEFEEKFLEHMDSVHRKFVTDLRKEGKLSDKAIEELKKAVTDFKKKF